ncbi:MAG: radical SAM protein [Candidatus Hadarchaeum sp.]|uniref:radical SAM protein n=1 Tax=Candidatus Hadarchaeum sp. TaxID=2883567 RepID=UPI003D1183FE
MRQKAVSIDVTNRCNLRCRHCFFWRANNPKELSIEGWEEVLRRLPKFLYCAWVGGEPLLRPELIETGKDSFVINEVVTNGTVPIPDWNDVSFFISIDGTKRYHELIRGKGTYERARENIETTGARYLLLNMVVNSQNYRSIEKFVSEWSNSRVLWVKFSFYTPFIGGENSLFLPFSKRNEVIDKVLKPLKENYGDFIFISNSILESMKYPNCLKVTSDCPATKLILSLDTMGNIKYRSCGGTRACYMGAGAICEKCGHMTPHYLRAIYEGRDWEIIRKSLKHMPRATALKAIRSLLPKSYLPGLSSQKDT